MKNKVTYFLSHFMLIGIGFSFILQKTKTNFILSIIFGYIFGLILIYLIKKLKLNTFSKIINYMYIIISGVIIVNFCHTLYLDNTPLIVLSIFTLLISYIFSTISEEAKIRSYRLLFIISITLFITKTLFLIKMINLENFLPMNFKISNILCGSIYFALYTSIPIVATIQESETKNILINYSIGCLTSFIITLITVGVLGIGESIIYRYPEYVVLRRIKFTEYVSNVENIFSFAIIIDLIISLSYFQSNINTNNKIKNFIQLILSIYIVYIITNNNNILMILYNYSPLICLIILIIYIFECIFKKQIHIINVGDNNDNNPNHS